MTNKTQPTSEDPREYISRVKNKTRQRDALTLLSLYENVTKEPAVMWGASIIGFGQYEYTTKSGSEERFLKAGFAPRAANMVVYLMTGVEQYEDLLNQMGPWKPGKACLYLGSFDKLDLSILRKVIAEDFAKMSDKYG